MEEEEAPMFDLSQKKKKKSKSKKPDLAKALEEASLPEGGEVGETPATSETLPEDAVEDPMKTFGSKKKGKKAKQDLDLKELGDVLPPADKKKVSFQTTPTSQTPAPPVSTRDDGDDFGGVDRDYTYDELLKRVYGIIREKNPEMAGGERKKFIMKPPQVSKLGTKKTAFANFADICKILRRPPKHLLQFLLAELGTSGSVDGNSSLIIKGRFQQKQIEYVLRSYIKEYVTCHTCKSPDTTLERDTRLFFLQCASCQSRCSVTSIQSGFKAVVGKRAVLRRKAP